jgi:hypothetical protein
VRPLMSQAREAATQSMSLLRQRSTVSGLPVVSFTERGWQASEEICFQVAMVELKAFLSVSSSVFVNYPVGAALWTNETHCPLLTRALSLSVLLRRLLSTRRVYFRYLVFISSHHSTGVVVPFRGLI